VKPSLCEKKNRERGKGENDTDSGVEMSRLRSQQQAMQGGTGCTINAAILRLCLVIALGKL
jgi:hypothetical protein